MKKNNIEIRKNNKIFHEMLKLKPYQRDMLRLIKEFTEPKLTVELPREIGKLKPTQSPALHMQKIGRANCQGKKPDIFFIDEAHYFEDKK